MRKIQTFRLKLNMYMMLLATCIALLMGLIQYIALYNVMSKNEVENRTIIEQKSLEAVTYIDSYYNLFGSSIEGKMREAILNVDSIYKEKGQIPSSTLNQIKDQYGFDLFIINKENIIIDSTYLPDIGLDFSFDPKFVNYLDGIREGGEFILDGISATVNAKVLKIFGYYPTADKELIIEAGFNMESNTSILADKTLDIEIQKIKKSSTRIESIYIVFEGGDSINKKDDGEYYQVSMKNLPTLSKAWNTRTQQYIKERINNHEYQTVYIPCSFSSGATVIRNMIIEIKFNSYEFETVLARNRQITLWVTVLSILISILISSLASKNVSRPLSIISESIQEITNGNLVHVADVNSQDEFQLLSHSFNGMVDNIRKLLDKIESNYLSTVRVLANAIEANDTYTKGHCERVTDISLEIARAMNLPESMHLDIEFAGLLHDIGKIGVPSEVLRKNGMLTAQELQMIKNHPQIGYKILEGVDFLDRSRTILHQHHERPDGTGYPKGIKDKDMLLESKILAVADAYDAMTSARPYRKTPLTKEKAEEQLLNYSGTQFNTEVVEVFIEILRTKTL